MTVENPPDRAHNPDNQHAHRTRGYRCHLQYQMATAPACSAANAAAATISGLSGQAVRNRLAGDNQATVSSDFTIRLLPVAYVFHGERPVETGQDQLLVYSRRFGAASGTASLQWFAVDSVMGTNASGANAEYEKAYQTNQPGFS